MRYNGIWILTFFVLLFSCAEKHEASRSVVEESVRLPYFNTHDFTPTWSKGTHKIPPFSLVNQNGDTITNTFYSDDIYIANFFFTVCPSICPKLTKSMHQLQEKYESDDDIQLLSHTVMPWYDTVPILAEYARKHGVNFDKWNLVTGTRDAIYDLAREGYFADEDFGKTLGENNFIHTENFVLVDKEGFIRGVYNGTLEVDLKRLSRHVELLKKEYE